MRRATAAALILLAATLATLLAPDPGTAAFPGKNGRIFVERGRTIYVGDTSGIWSMRPDGTHRRVVFQRDEQHAEQPEVSPSGRRIAFQRYPHRGLWIMRSDGSRVRRLARGSASEAAFSPNGRLVAYVSQNGPANRVFVIPPSGDARREPVASFLGTSHGDPQFVGNRKILFTSWSRSDSSVHLYSVRVDGTHRRRVTDLSGEYIIEPDVAPNRRRVLFIDGDQNAICIVKLDGTGRRCRVPRGTDDTLILASFSPNGRKIVFWEEKRGILTMNRDGSNLRRLTKSGSRNPDWAPKRR